MHCAHNREKLVERANAHSLEETVLVLVMKAMFDSDE